MNVFNYDYKINPKDVYQRFTVLLFYMVLVHLKYGPYISGYNLLDHLSLFTHEM